MESPIHLSPKRTSAGSLSCVLFCFWPPSFPVRLSELHFCFDLLKKKTNKIGIVWKRLIQNEDCSFNILPVALLLLNPHITIQTSFKGEQKCFCFSVAGPLKTSLLHIWNFWCHFMLFSFFFKHFLSLSFIYWSNHFFQFNFVPLSNHLFCSANAWCQKTWRNAKSHFH